MKRTVERAYAAGQGRFHVLDFKFPEPIPLELHLKDIVDKDVDDKYYINDKYMDGFVPFDCPDDVTDGIVHAGRLETMRGQDVTKRVYDVGGGYHHV